MTVVGDRIERITPAGVVTADGAVHPLDVIVYCTGFQAWRFLAGIDVTGSGGVDLHQRWGQDPAASCPGSPSHPAANDARIGSIRTAESGRGAMTEKVIVQFAGDGSGVAELSWGQQEIWAVIQAKDNSLPMGGARALPPGQTVADVAAGLRFIMSRHQALRTRLRFGTTG